MTGSPRRSSGGASAIRSSPTLWDLLGPYPSVLVGQTIGLLSVWLLFLGAFVAAVWLMKQMHDPGEQPMPMGVAVGAYGATLLPIAGGYFIAHYLTVVIQGAIWVPTLLADPLATVPPRLDWFPVSAIWYLSVGAIVLGHIVAVVLAHRLALRDARLRPVLAGLPLVLLMVGYTVLSLWIIAAPITVEPGTAPAAVVIAQADAVEVSIALAFAAGLLSFISPCVLALVPVYLAFLGETAAASDGSAARCDHGAGAPPGPAPGAPLRARASAPSSWCSGSRLGWWARLPCGQRWCARSPDWRSSASACSPPASSDRCSIA